MVEVLKNYINGEWVEPKGKETLDVVNPATLEVLAKVPKSTKEDVDAAVKAAKEAFWEWRSTPPLTRARYMFEFRNVLEEHFEELAKICTMEHGKTIDESRGEVRRAIEDVEVASGVPTLMMGYNSEDVAPNIDEICIRQPLGVCCALAPYNFPVMVPMWFLPYAVACGNTFIVKPSSQVPLSMKRVVELADEVGFPPGVINLVNGSRDVSNTLLDNRDVKAVSFVGSTPVALHVYKKAAETGKRAQCQGGAKNYMVVMPDAPMKGTVSALMTSACGCAGQRCLAGSIFIAVGEAYEPLKSALVDAASKLKVGYGLDEGVQMGPLAFKDQYDKVLYYIEKGVEEGAKLLLDGRKLRVPKYPNGYFVGPTIFDGVTPEMTIAKEEIFGPVMGLMRVETFDEAVEIMNRLPFGNAASIFTASGKWAREFQYRVDAGNIGVNIGIAAPVAFFPFSGWKDSFFGDLHAQGMDSIEFYTQKKVVISRWF